MKKQIIVISEVVSTLPNVVTVSVEVFLSSTFKNAYVLIDGSYVSSSKQVNQIKKHCQNIGLNPFIDGSYMEISYVYAPDWQAETDEECYNNPILETIEHLRECEKSALNYEISDLEEKLNKLNPWIDHPLVKRLFSLKSQLQAV